MNIQGKLHVKFDTQQVSDKFTKRDFVIEYVENPLYPQYVSFQLIQDKTALLDSYEVGAMIDVSFNIKGRSWQSPQGETRYFNSLEAWRIAGNESAGEAPAPPAANPDPAQYTEGIDDLPF